MLSRKFARSIAAGVAVIAIGGGTYGIVAATSSGASATASTSPASSAREGQRSRSRRRGRRRCRVDRAD
ncbi:MAG TPA: hypothetical protein VJ370_22170, partial [Streptosporangiaceae bacterium]|nr:hypothetical protein [Streptosporangiaceae bacterium]